MRSNVARVTLVVASITALAGGLRLWGLGQPERKIFDELYYASDACLYAGIPYRRCGLEDEGERSWVHPPLGKALIALGVEGFGNRPLGWRVAAAAAGTATVGLAGVLAYLLWRRALWAGVAAGLVAVEPLQFVQSRIAMLDIFLAFFVVLGFVLLVADRRRQEARAGAPGEDGEGPEVGGREASGAGESRLRPLRLAAGAAFGAAIAVKWSGIFALAGAFALAFVWGVSLVRRGITRPSSERIGIPVAMVLVPLLIYAAAWAPWLAREDRSAGELLGHHRAMADYHLTLDPVEDDGEPIHPYLSPAWSWLLLARPVAYYWQGDPACCEEILALGSPVLFWGSLLTIPYLAMVWWRRRDWRAGAVLVPILAQYLPWLAVTRPLFLFYMTPLTPFLALGGTFVLRDLAGDRLRDRPAATIAVAAVVVAAVALFTFFWPVLVGQRLSQAAWGDRIWFDSPGLFNWV
ncbi:MAG TPA: phospholipid carrier-dependent glycosyltransferase [Actinomycetota bacterium]|nr:phospholipid carrier-dependent glycosyltransferase [Actinomycetota bacterium]